MSRGKKSHVNDLTKLRRILDNVSDPTLKYLISKNEQALESVRRRLLGDFFIPRPQTSRFIYSSDSLEPRVTIRPMTTLSPSVMSVLPLRESYAPLPEFELVSLVAPTASLPSPAVGFLDEDLFEVEKIERCIPEFLEVTPKETVQEPQEVSVNVHDKETTVPESSLPEWQPVEEEVTASEESPQQRPVENAPEFERADISATSEEEPSSEWATSLQKEEQLETPVVFIPASPPEPSSQPLSKQQQRAAIKAQRRKEKDAKRQQKIEMKRIQKEQREKKRAEKRTAKQQAAPSTQAEFSTVSEISQIRVDYDNFKGIESIDETTAELLYKNGYFSIENIQDATIDDLAQIPGISRKLAKQIKKETDKTIIETDSSEFIPTTKKRTKKKEKKKLAGSSEWESSSLDVKKSKTPSPRICTYKGYTLYRRVLRKQGGKPSTFHYFAKKKSDKGHPAPLPEGYRIVVNKKTGVPYLKKKR